MNNIINKILAVVLASAVFTFTVACGTASPNKEPIYCVDGSTIIKDVDDAFKYYTEGLNRIDNEEEQETECKLENNNVRQYMYFPYEYQGEKVKSIQYSPDDTSGEERIKYIYISEGIEEAHILLDLNEMDNVGVVIPKSMRTIRKGKTKWDKVFYLGTIEEFNNVTFAYYDRFIQGLNLVYCDRFYQGMASFIFERNWYSADGTSGYKDNPKPTQIYYYSEQEPTGGGKYWRYVDGIPTVWESKYSVAGDTHIKDIGEKFKYYSEGMITFSYPDYYSDESIQETYTPEEYEEYKKNHGRLELFNVDKYVYFPHEFHGDRVGICHYLPEQVGEQEKIEYIFVSEGIEYLSTLFGYNETYYYNVGVVVPKSVTTIDKYYYRWGAVFYLGTPEEFGKVEFLHGYWTPQNYFGEENFINEYKYWGKNTTVGYGENTTPTPVYYYSEEEPTESGKYWRYVDGLPTVWE